MPLFGGGHKRECRKRCDSWFSLELELKDGCRSLCNSGRTEFFTPEEYLCSGEGPGEAAVIRRYGYDPCKGTAYEIEDFVDPVGERARQDIREQENRALFQDVLIVAGVLIVFALMGFFLLRSK